MQGRPSDGTHTSVPVLLERISFLKGKSHRESTKSRVENRPSILQTNGCDTGRHPQK